MRVGLLGGSFNPPHIGHLHISIAAMKGLHLDCVWWLVTPQNPLKEEKPLPFDDRVALSEKLITHPKILVSRLEQELGTSITYETIRALKRHYTQTDFVWISGMDNALNLHRWHCWRLLLREICMVHLTRYPSSSLVRSSPLRLMKNQKHVFIDKGGRLNLDSGISYWMLQKKMLNISSSDIRKSQYNTST